jgi:hypothetical protein
MLARFSERFLEASEWMHGGSDPKTVQRTRPTARADFPMPKLVSRSAGRRFVRPNRCFSSTSHSQTEASGEQAAGLGSRRSGKVKKRGDEKGVGCWPPLPAPLFARFAPPGDVTRAALPATSFRG